MNTGADKQRRALGKGLSALLPTRPAPATPQPTLAAPTTLPIDSIEPNPMQPRMVFQPERLEELAASIRANGIIQPLIVRLHGDRYQLVAGERRWRAAKLVGLTDVPVVIQDVAEPRMLELALLENIQREDLNPIETAQAYDRLSRELGLSQEEIGRRTGKERSSITNMIRLLRLPKEVQALVAAQRLSMGHARAILGLPDADDQIQIGERAAAQGLSVRQVETLVQELTADRAKIRWSEPEREETGPQRQGRRRRTGARPRHSRKDRRAQRAAWTHRDRVLFTSGTRPAFSADCRMRWCRRQESNLRPTDYETVALTT
jgi:ParB family chromosome partitioning protein